MNKKVLLITLKGTSVLTKYLLMCYYIYRKDGAAVDLQDDRINLVVKSNSLIQKTRYELSLQEQKLILFVISKIKPEDEDFMEYKIPLKTICEVCGIGVNGQNYKNFMDSIEKLSDKKFRLKTNEVDAVVRWIETPALEKRTKTLKVRINPYLRPYLLQLHENFTQYELGCVLAMKSKYSIRLYELLKSYAEYGEFEIDLDELKDKLQTAEYPNYKNFRVKVLEKAMSEINEYTDLIVSFEPIRYSRVIGRIRFSIKRKSSVAQVSTRVHRNAILDSK